MVAAIDAAREAGDTLGGVFEMVATGVPIGLGSHVMWDRKLDGRLAQAVMSIHAVKGVEIGGGFTIAAGPGSEAHDVIIPEAQWDGRPWRRASNRAGGLEGGMTNGEPVVVRGALKPISTLSNPLPSADLHTGQEIQAHYERSDICTVPAAGVVGEAMVAIVLAGRDAREVRRRFARRDAARRSRRTRRRLGRAPREGDGRWPNAPAASSSPASPAPARPPPPPSSPNALGWDVADTDEMIEKATGKRILEIFRDEGEQRFRDLEVDAVREGCRRNDVIVATGGGAVLREENRLAMADGGFVVCLEARPETILPPADRRNTCPRPAAARYRRSTDPHPRAQVRATAPLRPLRLDGPDGCTDPERSRRRSRARLPATLGRSFK